MTVLNILDMIVLVYAVFIMVKTLSDRRDADKVALTMMVLIGYGRLFIGGLG